MSSPTPTIIPIGEDHVAFLDGLTEFLSGDQPIDATLQAALKDTNGNGIVGGTITMAYQGGARKRYAGVIPKAATLLLTAGTTYWIDITGHTVSGLYINRRLTVVANIRTTN